MGGSNSARTILVLIAAVVMVLTVGCALTTANSAPPYTGPTPNPTPTPIPTPAAGQLAVTPASLDFGNTPVGNTGAKSITITNTGGTNVTISQIMVAGPGYSVTGITIPATLAAGATISPTVAFAPAASGGSTGNIQVSSSAPNSPATISLSGTGVTPAPAGTICGKPDDGMIHRPPNYTCVGELCLGSNPFPPPALKSASFTDPTYGCSVTRLTDVVGDRIGLAAHHQYGTITPINANDTYVMILLENGSQEIVDTSGNVVAPVANLPGTNTADVPWDISIPTRFYYAAGATLLRGDITGLPGCASTHNCTVTSTTLHDFTGTYANVQIPDQEDISEDGDHLWLVGNTSAFLYTISTNTVGKAFNVGAKDSGSGWHKIQIMPSNRMLMTWGPNGSGPGAGQEVYNTDTTLNWHMFDNTLHTDCGRDLSGNEVCVVARIPDTGGGITGVGACPTWDGHQDGGIDVINMTTHGAQCLVDVNFADTEISFRDGNANGGWVFITFFKSGSCPTYSCFDTLSPTHLNVSWSTDWVHFAEEGVLVRIDNNNSTSNKFRLFHTRSRSSEYYWSIPRGAISRDGKYVVFDSNFDISNTGLTDYTDVYLSKTR